jgi:alkanesulfonate monooxygenase SsuD/methylene tetrahydromethanopterin reductase-like flavin-dependent oxidoreductase (luciferase family)
VLAKSIATIDHISGGRVELGLGAGWNDAEHAAYGFPFPDLRTRMELLEEQLEIIHRQWGEDSVSFEGRHYRLDDCPALPKPLQQPHPPIIVGGMAGPRSVALAVRFADEYNTLLASVEDCVERKARLVEACERAGRDPDTLSLSLMATCVLGTDRSEVVERVRRVLEVWGADDQDPEAVLAERAARWVAGTPDEVVERLKALRGAGVRRVYLQHLAHSDVEMVALLGAEVLPAVQGERR